MIAPEYPRPSMYREHWRSLEGRWEFDFFDDYPITDAVHRVSGTLGMTIEVPFTYQCERSGIGDHTYHPCMVYRRRVKLTEQELMQRIILHFGAVDYEAGIWIDGQCIGTHTGGYTPFSFDITSIIDGDEFLLAIEAVDTLSLEQPRGKQSWCDPVSCWYTPSSGIWQPVWLEFVPDTFITSCSASGEITDGHQIAVTVELNAPCPGGVIESTLSFRGEQLKSICIPCDALERSSVFTFPLTEAHLWDVEHPDLYDITISCCTPEGVQDTVMTYAAFRTVQWDRQGMKVNGTVRALKLVLDQGYWPHSGYSAPSAQAFADDILLMKQMGFNGCRKHMKYEDPRFYHQADVLGFYVWEEAPAFYEFSSSSARQFSSELRQIIRRDAHHPSVITWVLCNESWGIAAIREDRKIQQWLSKLTSEVRAGVGVPVIDNDGWEHLSGQIGTFHSYEHTNEQLRDDWDAARAGRSAGVHGRKLYVDEQYGSAAPLLLTEFGGLSFLERSDDRAAWGYGRARSSVEEFFEAVKLIIESAEELPDCAGWCYTQFCDVQQEKNGLLFADRRPKFPLQWLQELIGQDAKQ